MIEFSSALSAVAAAEGAARGDRRRAITAVKICTLTPIVYADPYCLRPVKQ